MDPKVTTVPKTQSQSKDKDKSSIVESTVKLNIVKPESFTQFKFFLGESLVVRVECCSRYS